MIIRIFCLIFLSLWGTLITFSNEWLHIYRNDTVFNSFILTDITKISYSSKPESQEYFNNMQLETITGDTLIVPLDSIIKCQIGHNVPMLSITTTEFVDEIPDKENYLEASFTIEGNGIYEDDSCMTNIRGRGNTTWKYPKKPYRLKFPKKISLCGLPKAKSYVLLADYIDPSHMKNAVAFKIAELLDIPYTNHAIPVNVTLNGIYRGAYMLTEKIGIGSASVDIDENESILFEIDNHYDETYQFKTSQYNLPVMVKDPDINDSIFEYWKNDFNEFVNAVKIDTLDCFDYIDIESLANYLLVYNLVGNHEISWPKSIFMYKTNGDKYKMGPIWDFDWGFGYGQASNQCLFMEWYGHLNGSPFFKKMIKNERFLELYKIKWEEFKSNKLSELWQYIDDYANLLEPSVALNRTKWTQPNSFEYYVEQIKTYLKERIEFIDCDINYGLY